MAKYASHKVAGLFPLMGKGDLATLAEDIKLNGLQVPIELFEGKILDGRNREIACRSAGIEPDYVEVDPDDPVEYIWSINKERRHLDKSQLAMVGARRKAIYAERAKERQKAGGKAAGKSRPKQVPANLPEPNAGDARDQAGAAVGVSGRSVDAASKVIQSGSAKLQKAVDAKQVAVSVAAKLAELPKAKQDKALADGKEAIKAAVTPRKPKLPYPVFDHFLGMLKNITFFMGKIEEDYGSLTEFVNHKDWDTKGTPQAAGFLRAVTEGIVEFNQEMEKLCPPKS